VNLYDDESDQNGVQPLGVVQDDGAVRFRFTHAFKDRFGETVTIYRIVLDVKVSSDTFSQDVAFGFMNMLNMRFLEMIHGRIDRLAQLDHELSIDDGGHDSTSAYELPLNGGKHGTIGYVVRATVPQTVECRRVLKNAFKELKFQMAVIAMRHFGNPELPRRFYEEFPVDDHLLRLAGMVVSREPRVPSAHAAIATRGYPEVLQMHFGVDRNTDDGPNPSRHVSATSARRVRERVNPPKPAQG
jgi:hypothetical protein